MQSALQHGCRENPLYSVVETWLSTERKRATNDQYIIIIIIIIIIIVKFIW